MIVNFKMLFVICKIYKVVFVKYELKNFLGINLKVFVLKMMYLSWIVFIIFKLLFMDFEICGKKS